MRSIPTPLRPHDRPAGERGHRRAEAALPHREAPAERLRASNERRCRRILDRSGLLGADDLDWAAVGNVELDPGIVATLVYMRDVEGFTDSYVNGIGAHRTTLADPLIGEFLGVWQAEEAAHSLAIGRYLDAYAEAREVDIPPAPPSPTPAVSRVERLVVRVGGPVGRLVAAAHMAWGAANELLTMNGYRILADRCGDPVLAELLRRIAAQESRHYSFYLLQAEWRLADSRLARYVLPRILAGSWTPVGVGDGYKTDAEFQRVLAVLNASPSTAQIVTRMDRRFAALPGCADLRIFRDATAGSPAGPPPTAEHPPAAPRTVRLAAQATGRPARVDPGAVPAIAGRAVVPDLVDASAA